MLPVQVLEEVRGTPFSAELFLDSRDPRAREPEVGDGQLARGPSRLDTGAEGRAPGEQVDRRKVLDELVLLGPPAEANRILCARVHDACGAEADRLQRPGVGDVDLHALAAGSAVLVPG